MCLQIVDKKNLNAKLFKHFRKRRDIQMCNFWWKKNRHFTFTLKLQNSHKRFHKKNCNFSLWFGFSVFFSFKRVSSFKRLSFKRKSFLRNEFNFFFIEINYCSIFFARYYKLIFENLAFQLHVEKVISKTKTKKLRNQKPETPKWF